MFRIIDQKNIVVFPHKYKTVASAQKDIEKEVEAVRKNLTIINEKFLGINFVKEPTTFNVKVSLMGSKTPLEQKIDEVKDKPDYFNQGTSENSTGHTTALNRNPHEVVNEAINNEENA